MRSPDLLDVIRAALASDPPLLEQAEPVLAQLRQTYGGDTVYIRAPVRRNVTVTRRTAQRRLRRNLVSST